MEFFNEDMNFLREAKILLLNREIQKMFMRKFFQKRKKFLMESKS